MENENGRLLTLRKKDISEKLGKNSFLRMIERRVEEGSPDLIPSLKYFVDIAVNNNTVLNLGNFSKKSLADGFYQLCREYLDNGADVLSENINLSGIYYEGQEVIKARSVSRSYFR